MKPTLSIIIPMYNETAILPDTVRSLLSFLDTLTEPTEILLVDDGSTDGSADTARQCIGGDTRIRVTGYAQNRGKGGAVRHGVLESRGDYVVYTDCDLAYGTDAVRDIARALADNDNKDIMIGSRNLSADGYRTYTPLRRMMSKTYIFVIRTAAGFRLSDSQCGIKCFRGEAARRIFSMCQINSFAFDLEALLIADKLKYRIGEFPVSVVNHRDSGSKVHVLGDTLHMLRDIRRIKARIKHLC